jgi:hypothetical protein
MCRVRFKVCIIQNGTMPTNITALALWGIMDCDMRVVSNGSYNPLQCERVLELTIAQKISWANISSYISAAYNSSSCVADRNCIYLIETYQPQPIGNGYGSMPVSLISMFNYDVNDCFSFAPEYTT